MAHNIDDAAELLARQMQAFDLTVIQKKSLREAALAMGVSHTTVKAYRDAYRLALANERIAVDVEQRRASFDAELESLKAKALHVYEKCKDSKPLAAVGALNSAIATLAHQRAVQGLDTPKQVEAKEDVTYRVVWDDADDQAQGE